MVAARCRGPLRCRWPVARPRPASLQVAAARSVGGFVDVAARHWRPVASIGRIAGMAKLVDAGDLKSLGREAVWVRFPLPALPKRIRRALRRFEAALALGRREGRAETERMSHDEGLTAPGGSRRIAPRQSGPPRWHGTSGRRQLASTPAKTAPGDASRDRQVTPARQSAPNPAVQLCRDDEPASRPRVAL